MTALPLSEEGGLKPAPILSAIGPVRSSFGGGRAGGDRVEPAVGPGGEDGEVEDHLSGLDALLQLELQRLKERLGSELRRREQEIREHIEELRKQNLALRKREQRPMPPVPGAVREDAPALVDERLLAPSASPPPVSVPEKEGRKQTKSRGSSSKMFRLLPAWHLEAANLADSRILDGMSMRVVTSGSMSPSRLSEVVHSEELVHGGARGARRTWAIPPTSRLFLAWNSCFVLVLCFELLMFPMIVFDMPENASINAMTWFSLVFWTADVLLSFHIGYYSSQGNLVMDRKLIAWQYIRTWGIPDITIVMVDWLIILVDPRGKGAATILRLGKALKYVRLLRIVRLHKLHTAFRHFDYAINSQFFSIIKSLVLNIVSILVISHYVGCMWYLIGSVGEGEASWVRRYYKLAEELEGVQQWQWGYLTALHWSMTQFTPGSMDVQPQNSMERTYAVCVLVLGMIFFSTIVSSITSATASLKSLSAEHARQVWLLRRYFNEQEMSTELLARVMVYTAGVVRARQKVVNKQDVKLLGMLSESLQQEVTLELYSRHLEVHPFFLTFSRVSKTVFSKVCNEALSRSSLSSMDALFSAGQEARSMYFLVAGRLAYQSLHLSGELKEEWGDREVVTGTAFCEPVLWTAWVHQGLMYAEVASEIVALDARTFHKVVTSHRGDMWFPMKYGQEFVKRMNRDAGFFTETLSDDKTLSDLFEFGSIPSWMAEAAITSTPSRSSMGASPGPGTATQPASWGSSR